MGRAGGRIGMGMFVYNQRVQFAKQGHSWARAAPQQVGAHPGQAQSGTKGDAHFGEGIANQLGGFHFPEAWFGVLEDGLRQVDQLVSPIVDGIEYSLFEFFFGRQLGTSWAAANQRNAPILADSD